MNIKILLKINTNRVLRWRLILEEYVTEIEYIQGNKNMVTDALSLFTNNWIQNTTHKSN